MMTAAGSLMRAEIEVSISPIRFAPALFGFAAKISSRSPAAFAKKRYGCLG
jgi:hypothetical protein